MTTNASTPTAATFDPNAFAADRGEDLPLGDEPGGADGPRPRRHDAPALCYDVTRWHRLLFDARKAGSALDAAVAAVAGAVDGAATALEAEAAKATGALVSGPSAADRVATARHADAFVGEVYSRLYGDPERLDAPVEGAPGWAGTAHDVLDQLPEWTALRAAVAGDPDFAALATSDTMAEAAPRLAEALAQVERDRREQEEQEGGEGAGPEGSPGGGDQQAKAKRPAGPSGTDRLRAALRGAVAKAAAKAEERKEAMAGLAPGSESAPPTREHADPSRMRLAERLGKDAKLRSVLRRAGRLCRIRDEKRRERRDPDARSEVVDLERGADLGRALPAQLARLRHPRLRLLALKDIAERSMLQYRLEGKEKQGRGPLVVLLDRSGSMSGEPHEIARAVGVACVGIGAREKRAVSVVDFDHGVVAARHLTAKGEALSIDVGGRKPPTRLGSGRVVDVALDVATFSCGGGTDFGAVLRFALDGLPAGVRDERADLVMVTDGCAECDEQTLADLAEAKKRGLRVHALCVNGGTASPAIAAICDDLVDLDKAVRSGKDQGAAGVLP